jgi:hypothetical protein
MYIRSVWHPPQTNCAISVPAPNSGGRFDSEIFHLRAADTDITALVFMQWLKDKKTSELKKNLGTPVCKVGKMQILQCNNCCYCASIEWNRLI